jgi:hypothetical protein
LALANVAYDIVESVPDGGDGDMEIRNFTLERLCEQVQLSVVPEVESQGVAPELRHFYAVMRALDPGKAIASQ